MAETSGRHAVTRVRREPRRRTLTVADTEMLGAHMLRIRFTCDDFGGFESTAPDDHVKLFLPGFAPEGGRPAMRDYTPRAFDVAAGTITIDFAIHEAGPATAWAMAAKPGDTIQIGGPRGSAAIADDFDWYLLIGDETALPSIGRRLEELRSGVPVTVIASVGAPEDRFALPDREGLTELWSYRTEAGDETSRLTRLLDAHPLPESEGYVWIAAEASIARALRQHVIENLGHPREWVKAAGYWSVGVADAHERIED
jgi:NADPH-dependent ferric siderophore reductase